MSNLAFKYEDDSSVLAAVAHEEEQTILSVWNNAIPAGVQEEIDNYTLPPGKTDRVYGQLSYYHYPELKKLFAFANELCALYEDHYRTPYASSSVLFSSPAAEKPQSWTWHRDMFNGAARHNKINMLCVMRQSQAQEGEFQYIDASEAGDNLVFSEMKDFGYARGNYYVCKDEQKFAKSMPINSAFSFLCDGEEGLVHRSTMTEGGLRVKITVSPRPGF